MQEHLKAAPAQLTHNQTIQEMCSIAIWNPIASFMFCTGMLPIVPTNTSPPITYSDTTNSNLRSSGNNSNLTNIITYFKNTSRITDHYSCTTSGAPQCHSILRSTNLQDSPFGSRKARPRYGPMSAGVCTEQD